MKRLAGLIALAVVLSFGAGTITYAGDPAPAPTDGKGKDKKSSGPKVFADEDKKHDKKDGKGGH